MSARRHRKISRELIMAEASTDSGTVLPTYGWAVLWNEQEGFSLLMPNFEETDVMPDEGLALTATMLRLKDDPDFLAEMAGWMNSQRND